MPRAPAQHADVDSDVELVSLAAALLLDGAIAHQPELGERFRPAAVTHAIVALLRSQLRSVA